tara:strand:+ start:318 stop:680 length:363 start_codon:yes stop_codon:yes gene_type:complete
MAYDIATRLDKLGTRMKELNQNSITYQRTGETDLTISNVTPGTIDVTQLGVDSVVLITEKAQDFIFDTSELSSWSPVVPKIGDTIVWGSNTYQIFSINDELYNYTTSSRLRIRVHTKQVS